MARFFNEAVDTQGWTMVAIPHREWAVPLNVDARWDDLRCWLNDPARPGNWQVHSGGRAFYYFISDPDVAFEFKIRYG